MFIVHNFMATVHGASYDFDYYEYEKNNMVICESPDLDIAILLPKRNRNDAKIYMLGAIKNYFNNMGVTSAIRHVGTMAFDDSHSVSSDT